jgi:hypothetical protein
MTSLSSSPEIFRKAVPVPDQARGRGRDQWGQPKLCRSRRIGRPSSGAGRRDSASSYCCSKVFPPHCCRSNHREQHFSAFVARRKRSVEHVGDHEPITLRQQRSADGWSEPGQSLRCSIPRTAMLAAPRLRRFTPKSFFRSRSAHTKPHYGVSIPLRDSLCQ